MLCSARNSQISIGLLVMVLALATTVAIQDYSWTEYFVFVRIVQPAATGVLLFGILGAHPQHKANLMLVWLLATSLLIFVLILHGCIKWKSLVKITVSWSAAAAVSYMFIIMYNHYVELTQGTDPQSSEPEQIEEPSSKPNNQITVLITHPKISEKV